MDGEMLATLILATKVLILAQNTLNLCTYLMATHRHTPLNLPHLEPSCQNSCRRRRRIHPYGRIMKTAGQSTRPRRPSRRRRHRRVEEVEEQHAARTEEEEGPSMSALIPVSSGPEEQHAARTEAEVEEGGPNTSAPIPVSSGPGETEAEAMPGETEAEAMPGEMECFWAEPELEEAPTALTVSSGEATATEAPPTTAHQLEEEEGVQEGEGPREEEPNEEEVATRSVGHLVRHFTREIARQHAENKVLERRMLRQMSAMVDRVRQSERSASTARREVASARRDADAAMREATTVRQEVCALREMLAGEPPAL